MEIRVCPECRSVFPPSAQSCASHGSVLVDVRGTHPMLGQWIADRFLLLELLGQGGMGDVFLAWQASMQRKVAIKVVSQEVMIRQGVLERFRREAHLTASLRSPHTVGTFDYGSLPNGMQYFAMEYIPGQTLAEILVQHGPLPVEQACDILQQVCLSLEEAHDTGIVHRDLKPGNVMITSVGKGKLTAKVLDFGIAKLVGPEAQVLTETGAAVGTPVYMSPEQARGQAVSPATDVYAMGLLAFELVTGRRAFEGQSISEIVAKHLETAPPTLAEVAPELTSGIAGEMDAIIQKCLQKRPEDRYANGGELRQAFEGAKVRYEASRANLKAAPTPIQATAIMPGYAASDSFQAARTPAVRAPSASSPIPSGYQGPSHSSHPAPVQPSRPASAPTPAMASFRQVSQHDLTEAMGPTVASTPTTPLVQNAVFHTDAVLVSKGGPVQKSKGAPWAIIAAMATIVVLIAGVFAAKAIWGDNEPTETADKDQSATTELAQPAATPETAVPSTDAAAAKPVDGARVVKPAELAEAPQVDKATEAKKAEETGNAKQGETAADGEKLQLADKKAEEVVPVVKAGGTQGQAIVAPPVKPVDLPVPKPVQTAQNEPGTPPSKPVELPTWMKAPGKNSDAPAEPKDPACKAALEVSRKSAGLVKGAATCESARRAAKAAVEACTKEVALRTQVEEMSTQVEKACQDAIVAACVTASGEYAALVEVAGKKPDCSRIRSLRKEAEEKCSSQKGIAESYRSPLAELNTKLDKQLCPAKKSDAGKAPAQPAANCGECLDGWGWAKADAAILWGDACKKKLAPYLKGGSTYNKCKSCPGYTAAVSSAPACAKEAPAQW